MSEKNLIKTEVSDIEAGNLYEKVRGILDSARVRVARSVNSEMLNAYWHIGQAIVEVEQKGKERADYGKQLVESLSKRLKAEGLKGFSRNNLWYMRQFYLTYSEKLHALRGELTWTHYRLLLKVERAEAGEFYETDWGVRFLRGCAARCAERLCLSGWLSLSFAAMPPNLRRSLKRFGEQTVRRGRAVAAHRAAQPQKQVLRTFADTNAEDNDNLILRFIAFVRRRFAKGRKPAYRLALPTLSADGRRDFARN